MPLQLLLDISTASARSKGQARRRIQPATSEDARKAQRNLARRERAKCKKARETRQQLLPSAHSLPPASRPQQGLTTSSTDRVPLEMILLEPLQNVTEPSGHTDDKTIRAPTHPTIHSTAKSKAQRTKAAMRKAPQRVEDVSNLKASDRVEEQITSQEQDLNAAGILVKVAREQHPISSVQKIGDSYTRKCPVTSCAYHLARGFWSKTEKNNHIMTHFEGEIGFVLNENRYSLPWPSFIEDPENFFPKIEILKRRVQQHFIWYLRRGDPGDSPCHMCLRSFDQSGYLEHLDDCIIHAVQIQPCSAFLCEHDPPRYHWGSDMNEPMVEHFVPSLGCSRCYAIHCHCHSNTTGQGFCADGSIRPWDEIEKI